MPMIVFLVWYTNRSYEDEILGVFSSDEKARAFVAAHRDMANCRIAAATVDEGLS